MAIYDYICSQGHVTEKLVRGTEGQEEISCPSCLSPAKRQSAYLVNATGLPTRSPRTPLDQREIRMGAFNEASAELAYNHERAEQKEGMQLAAPPLWQMAKREARRLQKLGVHDSADLR